MSSDDRSSAWHRYRRFFRQKVHAEVGDELRFHFEMRVAELIERGFTSEEARDKVLARLGDLEAYKAECVTIDQRQQRREARVHILETMLQDLRLVMRSLGRQKVWAAVVIMTLALGIGANAALFTIINAVLLRPLPYPNPNRIVSISEARDGIDQRVVPEPTFLAWQSATRSFTSVAAYGGASTIMAGADGPETVNGLRVTRSYFSTLGVRTMIGRTFAADEDKPGGPSVVILSAQIWRRVFNADSMIVGRTVPLDDVPATVVGIMPDAFTSTTRAQYWIPYQIGVAETGSMSYYYYSVLGRLRDGISFSTATTELAAISKRANASRGPEWQKSTPLLMTLHDRRYGDTKPALYLLFGAVGVLLLIACANVSNLLLARAASRQREFAVRVALGASTWRLVRYLLSESLLLSLVGGGLGLLLAYGSVGYFVRLSPQTIAQVEGVHVDAAAIAFTTAIAVLTGVIVGLIPVLAVRRTDINETLTKSGSRSTGGRGQNRLRRVLVIGELATALVLLTAAGLLTKSFAHVTSVDTGIAPERILTATIDLSRKRYRPDAARDFYDALLERVAALPGVDAVSIADAMPLGGMRMSTTVTLDGKKSPRFDISAVSDFYFKTLGVRVVAGRAFSSDDRKGATPVMVVNQTMSRAVFPGQNPIGQTLPLGEKRGPIRIVGVVRDVLQHGVEEEANPMVYLPVSQEGAATYMTLLVRTAGEPESLVPPIRAVVKALDAAQPPPAFASLEQQLANAVAPRRFSFVLLSIFAGIAGILAAIGLYGVMAYLVAERTNEIGIRIALGADRARVMRFVIGEGMLLGGIGIGLGLAGSLAAVRALRTMLFHVSIYDPSIFTAGAGLLAAVALAACGLPAFRASRVDPIQALRAE
jgi:putative ABC transport system permease protein